jgi:exodeoxyribonuclease VII small subunit
MNQFAGPFTGSIRDTYVAKYDTKTPGSRRSRAFYPALLCLIARNAKMPATAKKLDPEPNFETAMNRLEAIVEQMESGKMMLEELIVRYEEGMKLVKVCQERLASAERRIEIITRDNAGQPVVKDFEPAVEASPRVAKSEGKRESENDEVKLF